MLACLLTEAVVHDVEAYEKYKQQAPLHEARHGGEGCCRGGEVEVLVRDRDSERMVMLKLPSREALNAFRMDPDYKPWKELRESLTTVKTQVILEGI
jgi:uncharacterized protein (DUF1330 family)